MQPIVTNGVVCFVCRSVCHDREPCKNGWTDRDAIWDVDSGGPKELCIRLGPDPPREEAILRGKMAVVKYRDPQPWAVQKRLYRLGCILWCWVGWVKGTMYYVAVHIGATWRIWLNHPCVAVMRPYVKLLWPVVLRCFRSHHLTCKRKAMTRNVAL